MRSWAVNFDWYHPKYAHRYEEGEIKRWFEEKGLKVVSFKVELSGISVRGEKPPSRL